MDNASRGYTGKIILSFYTLFFLIVIFAGLLPLSVNSSTVPCRYQFYIFPLFLIYLSPPLNHSVYLLWLNPLPMAYFPQTSELPGSDSNKPTPNTGPNIQPSHFNPFLQNSHVPNIPSSHTPTFPYFTNHTSPVVPQPLGTNYASQSFQFFPLAPYNGFPNNVPVPVPVPGLVPVPVPVPVPGLVPRENNPRISEYSSHHNTIPQVENSHKNSHSNSSSWSSGFTNILQDLTLDRSEARTPSHHTQDNKVSQSFDFQRIIASTKDIVQAAYFSLNTLFDISQIRTFENFYIGLEN